MVRSTFNFDPVIRTAVEECNVPTKEDAENLLDAFLQWVAAMPGKEEGQLYVMLKSDVDRIFHAFVLNTSLYRDFCDTYFAHFIDHTPLDERGSRPSVSYTVSLLQKTYGESLHPSLAEWAGLLDEDAWEVSCGSC